MFISLSLFQVFRSSFSTPHVTVIVIIIFIFLLNCWSSLIAVLTDHAQVMWFSYCWYFIYFQGQILIQAMFSTYLAQLISSFFAFFSIKHMLLSWPFSYCRWVCVEIGRLIQLVFTAPTMTLRADTTGSTSRLTLASPNWRVPDGTFSGTAGAVRDDADHPAVGAVSTKAMPPPSSCNTRPASWPLESLWRAGNNPTKVSESSFTISCLHSPWAEWLLWWVDGSWWWIRSKLEQL